jgi:hypothetical protein
MNVHEVRRELREANEAISQGHGHRDAGDKENEFWGGLVSVDEQYRLA